VQLVPADCLKLYPLCALYVDCKAEVYRQFACFRWVTSMKRAIALQRRSPKSVARHLSQSTILRSPLPTALAPRLGRTGRKIEIASNWTRRSFSTSGIKKLAGPAFLYEEKVKAGILREDEYQRTVVAKLQSLHDELMDFNPPPVPEPIEYASMVSHIRMPTLILREVSLVWKIAGADSTCGSPRSARTYAERNVPSWRRRYVLSYDSLIESKYPSGCGKTMLMDLL